MKLYGVARWRLVWFCGFFLIGLCSGGFADEVAELYAQRPVLEEQTLVELMEESLEDRAARIAAWEQAMEVWVGEMADLLDLQVVVEFQEGEDPEDVVFRQIVDFRADGTPVYRQTNNVEASEASNTRGMREGRLGLTGANEVVGVWDGGSVLNTHQEFELAEGTSRVTLFDGFNFRDHATHVAGTIGAAGVREEAVGVVPEVAIQSYDWNGDVSEMTAAVARNDIDFTRPAVTNHSYGPVLGWYVDTIPGGDPTDSDDLAYYYGGPLSSDQQAEFGRYTDRSAALDALAYRIPAFLQVWSAGNDRSNNPADGQRVYYRSEDNLSLLSKLYDEDEDPAGDGIYKSGFDTVTASNGAKNVLTVGNFTESSEGGLRDPNLTDASRSTSWGPMDDGRIKPDVVANGTSLFSSIGGGNQNYGNKTGTSMAAPGVSGLIVQLQERSRMFSPPRRMMGAEVKGLVIHTADDIGRLGPDYESGWGLVNGLSAEYVMRNARQGQQNFALIEGTMPGATFGQTTTVSHTVNVEVGEPTDYKVTLVWADPPGQEDAGDDDATPSLVYDLNLVVSDGDGVRHFPFVLDPRDPTGDARRGVNRVDNVEQVILPGVGSGNLTLEVSHVAPSGAIPQNYYIWASPVTDPVAIEADVLEAPAARGRVTQRLYSESEWAVMALPDWISVRNRTGSGAASLVFELDPNFDSAPRSHQVYVEVAGQRGEIDFEIVQEGYVPVPGLTIAGALELPFSTRFSLDGDADWFPQTLLSRRGGDAVSSGPIGDDEETGLQMEVEGPARISFDYFSDSEFQDEFFFDILAPGEQPDRSAAFIIQSGPDKDWQTKKFTLGEGTWVLDWRYYKDSSVSVGLDRVVIDDVRIERLELPEKELVLSKDGGEVTFRVNAVDTTRSWEVKEISSWFTVSPRQNFGTEDLTIRFPRNYGLAPRMGSFQVGSEELGYQTVSVLQGAQVDAPVPLEDVFDDARFTFEQNGNGPQWKGSRDLGRDGGGAIYAHDIGWREDVELILKVEGPGLLSFREAAELSNEGSLRDGFDYAVNGVRRNPVASSDFGMPRVEYLGEGMNEVKFYYVNQIVDAKEAVRISNLLFTRVRLSPLEVDLPAVGGEFDFVIEDLEDGADWELASNRPSVVTLDELSGVTDAEVGVSVLADTVPGRGEKSFSVKVGEQPFYDILIHQQEPGVVSLERAGDVVGSPLVAGNSALRPALRTIGQDVVTADGRDAIALGQEPGLHFLRMNVSGPALVSFDYFLRPGKSGDSRLSVTLDGVVAGVWDTPSVDWATAVVEVPDQAGMSLEWSVLNNGFPNEGVAYLDRIRVLKSGERPTDVGMVGGRGGSLVFDGEVPVDGLPEWIAAVLDEDGRTRLVYEELPEGVKSRSAEFEVDGEEVRVVQVDLEQLEGGFLSAVGAGDVDEVLLDSRYGVEGDLDGDGMSNGMEWLYQRDPLVADSGVSFEATSPGIEFPMDVRLLEWAAPVLRGGEDLPGSAVFSQQGGVWTSSDAEYEIVEDAGSGNFVIRRVDGAMVSKFFLQWGMRYK